MSSLPTYRLADRLAPYREYRATARLFIAVGGMQLPLAYKAVASGETPRRTSRLLQGQEPTCWIVVEWDGIRERDKPEPPVLTVLGDFVLQAAAAQVDSVKKDTDGQDIIAASGYFILLTDSRPEELRMPAFWTPYDGRYGSSPAVVPQYLYTPAELGFRQFLPGIENATTPGNPILQPAAGGGNQIKGGLLP